jgi:hypothetical protein
MRAGLGKGRSAELETFVGAERLIAGTGIVRGEVPAW